MAVHPRAPAPAQPRSRHVLPRATALPPRAAVLHARAVPRGTWLGRAPPEGYVQLGDGPSDVEAGKEGEGEHSWVHLFWGACKYVWPQDPWLQVSARARAARACVRESWLLQLPPSSGPGSLVWGHTTCAARASCCCQLAPRPAPSWPLACCCPCACSTSLCPSSTSKWWTRLLRPAKVGSLVPRGRTQPRPHLQPAMHLRMVTPAVLLQQCLAHTLLPFRTQTKRSLCGAG